MHMKSKAILYLPLAGITLIILGFGGAAKWPGGSPGGYTGSPGDGKNCTYCHGGNASQVLGWISSDVPQDGYVPGETYTITVSVSGNGDKGFEVSPQNQQGGLLGSLVDGPGIHLVAGNTAVTQDDATSANPAQWQFDWTAPDEGTGPVTFYGAFTVNKPVTKLSSYTVQENTGVSIPEYAKQKPGVFPNPADHKINISYWADADGAVSIDLVSISGARLGILNGGISKKGINTVEYDLPSWISPGIYFIQIHTGKDVQHLKLLVK